ncbi:unnamed protein product [Notodromas monacha]|uniref:G-protein coupled receptors family 1 profile domain-containing protein n=1 Tax=Notodromas monacha TaxID=399045 RepID=A0A7R9BHF2_9CRUS|nr:unnamed protein product [Notodromas monacha]CAG0915556.1 unnamed protein product [Notodromas monacha]
MYKRSSLAMMVVSTWVSAFVFLLPTLLEKWGKFGLDLEIGSCSILPVNGQSPKVISARLRATYPLFPGCTSMQFVPSFRGSSHKPERFFTGPHTPYCSNAFNRERSSFRIKACVEEEIRCDMRPKIARINAGDSSTNEYTHPKEFLFVVAFALPCIVIIVCYARIFLIARKAEKKVNRGAKRGPRVSAAIPSSSTTTTTGPSTSSTSTTSTTPATRKSRIPKLGLIVRDKLSKVAASPARNGFSGTDVETDAATQNYVLKIEDKTGVTFVQGPVRVEVSAMLEPEDSKPDDSNGEPSPKLPQHQGSAVPAGILLSSEDDKPEQDKIATFAVDVIEMNSGVSASPAHPAFSAPVLDEVTSFQEMPVEDPDSVTNPRLVSCLGVKRNTATGMSVNFTLSSIRRTASKYKRGSFRTGLSAKDVRLLKMILTIFVAFVACYLPITTVKALGKEAEWPIASVISNLLIYLTTCINPLIYVAMSSEYRLAYKNLLTCRSDRECSTRSSSKNT